MVMLTPYEAYLAGGWTERHHTNTRHTPVFHQFFCLSCNVIFQAFLPTSSGAPNVYCILLHIMHIAYYCI